MAIAMNFLTSGRNNGAGGTTASITPGSNTLILAAILTHGIYSPGTTIGDAHGLTWVQFLGPNNFGSSSNFGVWRALAAGPTSGSYSITTSGSVDWTLWCLFEFSGVDSSSGGSASAIVQTTAAFSAGATSITCTLGAFADPANATAMICGGREDSVFSAGGTTTLIDTQNTAGGAAGTLGAVYELANDTTPSMNSTGAIDLLAYALEVKAAAVVPPPMDTFIAAWGMQAPAINRGLPTMVASGSRPSPRVL